MNDHEYWVAQVRTVAIGVALIFALCFLAEQGDRNAIVRMVEKGTPAIEAACAVNQGAPFTKDYCAAFVAKAAVK